MKKIKEVTENTVDVTKKFGLKKVILGGLAIGGIAILAYITKDRSADEFDVNDTDESE